MTVLVTGATGRIGRHLVPALLARGETVRCLVRPTSPRPWDGVDYAVGDITDPASLRTAMDRVATVYHLAARVVPTGSREDFLRANVDGTRNLLAAAAGRRVVCVSSCSVYGMRSSPAPLTEAAPCAATDRYGATKAAADRLATEAGAVVLRPPLVYGAGISPGFWQVFGLLERGLMPIIGSGRNRLHYVHVSDVVSALLLAAERGRPGQAYNITGDDIRTQTEVLGIAARCLGVRPPRFHVPTWVVAVASLALRGYASRADVLSLDRIYDTSKAKRELGWQPQVGYEEGIAEVVADYKKRAK